MLEPTVLIVDDEKPTREGLRAALDDRYDVYLAEDGEGAVRLLEEDAFDVLLTDLRMPGVGGLDLIKRAKSLSKPPIALKPWTDPAINHAVACHRGTRKRITDCVG